MLTWEIFYTLWDHKPIPSLAVKTTLNSGVISSVSDNSNLGLLYARGHSHAITILIYKSEAIFFLPLEEYPHAISCGAVTTMPLRALVSIHLGASYKYGNHLPSLWLAFLLYLPNKRYSEK
jgi:hypothetical protein